jgi:hypothetical protein
LANVAILDHEHLFQQADRLVPSQRGRPRQADIRRAISAAYYGLFHAILTAATDQFVGKNNRDLARYGLVYRSVEHSRLRDLCNQVRGRSDRIKPYAPSGGFDPEIRAFAAATVDLQEKRFIADYDVMVNANRSTALLAIAGARAALVRFNRATEEQREAFLSLLLFKPR